LTLTFREVRALPQRSQRYRVSVGAGLLLEVDPAGGKYWLWRHCFPPPWTADGRICASGPIQGPRSKPPATSAMSRNVFSMKTESIPVLPREVFAACLKGLQLPVLVAVACVVRAPACGIRSLCPGLVCWGSLDHHSRLTQATHPRPLRPGEPGGAGRHRGGPAPLSGSEARSWLKLAGGSHSCSSQHPRPATRFAAGSPAGDPAVT
jgi:hypothetical protein